MIDQLLDAENKSKPSKIYEGIVQIQYETANPMYLTYEIQQVKKHVKDARKTLVTTPNYKEALSIIGDSPSDLKNKADHLAGVHYVNTSQELKFIDSFNSTPNKVELTVFVYTAKHHKTTSGSPETNRNTCLIHLIVCGIIGKSKPAQSKVFLW